MPTQVPCARGHPLSVARRGRVAPRLPQSRQPAVQAPNLTRRGELMIAHRLYVGTIGEGIFRSLDHGQTFRRAADGMFVECDVRALVVHPHRPKVLYLGSEQGIYVSRDGADSWACLPAPLKGEEVWSLWLTPSRPETIFVGIC